MHASVNVGCQGKSGPGKIHEVILVRFTVASDSESRKLLSNTSSAIRLTSRWDLRGGIEGGLPWVIS